MNITQRKKVQKSHGLSALEVSLVNHILPRISERYQKETKMNNNGPIPIRDRVILITNKVFESWAPQSQIIKQSNRIRAQDQTLMMVGTIATAPP